MKNSGYQDREGKGLSRDERFLHDLCKVIESNLDNEEFGVEDLAEAMSMSRIHLYRKLQGLTGKNVSQFIREVRLEHAMELLKQDVATISEIAYRVGFGSPAYFNKCFHKFYGFPPGEVKKNGLEGERLSREDLGKQEEEIVDIEDIRGDRKDPGVRKLIYIISGIILVFLGIIGGWYVLKDGAENSGSSLDDISMDKTLIVMPFRNDSADPENEYFCAGMRESIINHLVKIGELKVRTGVNRVRL